MHSIKYIYTLSLFVLIVLLAIAVTPAQAQTQACDFSITGPFPFTTTGPGVWCLDTSPALSLTTGCAITIGGTGNVILDLNGSRLGNGGAPINNTAVGICVDAKRNVTIKNGSVRGFLRGIQVTGDSRNILIEDVAVDQNFFIGMDISASTAATALGGIFILNNIISNIGVANATLGTPALVTTAGNAYGIKATGKNIKIAHNIITEITEFCDPTFPTTGDTPNESQAIGILLDNVISGIVEENNLTDSTPVNTSCVNARGAGIQVGPTGELTTPLPSTDVIISANRVTGTYTLPRGIFDIAGTSTGQVTQNRTFCTGFGPGCFATTGLFDAGDNF